MSVQLQNRVEEKIQDIFNITKIKNIENIHKNISKGRKFSFQSYYSLSDDEEWSNLSHNDSSISTIKTSPQTSSLEDSDSSSSSSSRTPKKTQKHTSKKRKMKKKLYSTRQKLSKSKKEKYPTDEELCKQSLAMIKFLGPMKTRKLDFKHDPKNRRIAFLEWLSNIEVAL